MIPLSDCHWMIDGGEKETQAWSMFHCSRGVGALVYLHRNNATLTNIAKNVYKHIELTSIMHAIVQLYEQK